ncbi:hypothetical protein Zmor_023020 [Zophobas morio]|uniref:Serine/arginine-rich splicing factor 2 n=1 Tax=Zophobas morio TaxID=2755281 RepID=A0AA38M746_9CUCU|nr:hypothetical protein Zmor_023020 [Zophobas morio]
MSYGRPPPRIDGMVSLKVDNLTYRTTPEDLRRVFERCGDVGDIYIPRDRFTRESRGFAFVRFYDKRDAEDALDAMDGRMLDGRELRVQMARYADRRRHTADTAAEEDHVLGLGTRGHVRGHAEGGAGRDRRTVPAAAHVPARQQELKGDQVGFKSDGRRSSEIKIQQQVAL